MSTPTPPGGDQPTTNLPQTPPSGPAYGGSVPPGTSSTGGTAAPVPPEHGKNKALPWQIATGVLALTTIGFGIWGFSTNSKLNDLQASTNQQVAALEQQLKQLEQASGAKEASQAKEIAKLKREVAGEAGRLKVDNANIKKETQQLDTLNAEYRKQQQQADAAENNLKQQLQASQAKTKLASQCATVLAAGVNKLYADVATVVTYKEVNQVIKSASANCGGIVTLD